MPYCPTLLTSLNFYQYHFAFKQYQTVIDYYKHEMISVGTLDILQIMISRIEFSKPSS